MAMLGSDGFGVKLHAVDRQFTVLQSHYRAILQLCRDFQTLGQALTVHHKRMVTRCCKRAWQSFKQTFARMLHLSYLAMDDLVAAHNLAAEGLANALMTKANPDQGCARLRRQRDHLKANTRLIRIARPGREHHPSRIERHRVARAKCVIAHNLNICAKFAQIMHQIIGKTVVIIDQQQHVVSQLVQYVPHAGPGCVLHAQDCAQGSRGPLSCWAQRVKLSVKYLVTVEGGGAVAKGAFSGLVWGVVVAGLGAGGLSLAYPDFKPGGGLANTDAPGAVSEAALQPEIPEANPTGESAPVPAPVPAPVVQADVVADEAPQEEAVPADAEAALVRDPDITEPDMSEAETPIVDMPAPDLPASDLPAPDGPASETSEAESNAPALDVMEPDAPLDVAPEPSEDNVPEATETAEAEQEQKTEQPAEQAQAERITDEIIAALPAQTEGTVGNLAPQVTTNRLPTLGQDAAFEADAESAQAPPPVERFAAEFTVEEGKPLMAIVLIDEGDSSLGVEALESFPYPLTFAVDANGANAAERMQIYREKGFEVLALVDLPRGATASDVEVAMSGYFAALPEVVGVLEGVQSGVQSSREMADQLTQIILDSGHGMLLQASGLNTARKLAEREGIPAGTVFRDFDGNGQSASVMRRFLDQAAFRAGQEGGVVMMGRLQAETISALLIWGLADRASRVSLVPVSAVLTQGASAE